ncbi:MAG: transcriptional repressor LexA, partial [candidate division KSB1 bacterium]|nr:transcriptional repressor LexA [candidate division KSB1 bacterium]
TLQELTEELGASSRNTAVKHLSTLARKGYIVWEKNIARGIRVLETGGELTVGKEVRLPLVGTVTAGMPILAEENIERYLAVPKYLLHSPGRHFLLRVKGDSMRNAGILHNDVVIVRSQQIADLGDIVVALIGNEATVKRLAAENGRLYLKAENPLYPDLRPEEEWSIQGKVVALLRENVE